MGANSKQRRDKKKKAEQKKRNLLNANKPARAKEPDFFEYQALTSEMFNPLTTPNEINSQVLSFTAKINNESPIYLDCQPEPWSRQSLCDMNVERYIRDNGGQMLCGYRIWYTNPIYIEAERHAVWVSDGQIRDVSFVDTGETRILFLPDETAGQLLDSAPKKIRHSFSAKHAKALEQYEMLQARSNIQEMPPEMAWSIMPSHSEWLSGTRMPNIIPTLV